MLMSIITIPTLILSIALMLNMKTKMNREKSSPFECGFDPTSSSRVPFSFRFFLLAVIFLVFDIEIVLILPLPLMLFKTNFLNFLWPMLMFISILLLGLLHEWNEGSLEWAE